MILFLIGMVLFYFLMKHEANKDDIDDIKKIEDVQESKEADDFRK